MTCFAMTWARANWQQTACDDKKHVFERRSSASGQNNWTGGATGERATGGGSNWATNNWWRIEKLGCEQLEGWKTNQENILGTWNSWRTEWPAGNESGGSLNVISKFKKKTRKSRKHRLRMRRRGSYNVIAILAICPTMVRIFFGISVRPWRGNTDISVHIFILYIKHRQYLFRIFACYDTLQYNVIMWYSSIWWLFLQSKNTQ